MSENEDPAAGDARAIAEAIVDGQLAARLLGGSRRKLRALELKTEEGWRRGRYSGPRVHETKNESQHEREFAEQIETAYRRFVEDWQPKPNSGAGATRGRARSSHLLGEERAARQGSAPEPAL